MQEQIDKKVKLGHYSGPFGPDLLPGIYSMPIHAVPKPSSKKFHPVTDHSAGQFALNNMISHKAYRHMPMHPSTLADQAGCLLLFQALCGSMQCLWESHIPAHLPCIHIACHLDHCHQSISLICLLYLYVNNSFPPKRGERSSFTSATRRSSPRTSLDFSSYGNALACRMRSTNRSLVMSIPSLALRSTPT